MLRLRYLARLLLLACCVPAVSRAHEGHQHEETEAPTAMVQSSALNTPQIEAVAQREGGDIVLYLDDYASNAPLDGLQVSVRSGTLTVEAAGGEGRYHIPADVVAGNGQPLAVSVHGAGFDTEVAVELPPAAPVVPAPRTSQLLPRLASAALILGLLFAARLLRRRRGADAGRGAWTA